MDIPYTVTDNNASPAKSRSTVHITIFQKITSSIAMIKTSGKPTRNNDGTFNWTYTLKIINGTNHSIDSVQVEDNLDAVFNSKGCTYKLVGITASGELIANSLYNGSNVIKALIEGKSVGANKTDSIRIGVRVDTHGQTDTVKVFNQAEMNYKISVLGASFTTASNIVQTDIPVIDLYIPDGFTPNGDSWNNTFVISHSLEFKIEMEVFNRWGNSVYKNVDYKNDWDGKGTGNFLGKDLPSGTYYIIYKAINTTRGEVVAKGIKYMTLRR